MQPDAVPAAILPFKMKQEWAKEFEKREAELKENPGTEYFKAYYKGYGLKEVSTEDGLERNDFVYRGTVYVFPGSKRKKTILKIVHIILVALSVLCMVICGIQTGIVNDSKIFAAPFFAVTILTVIRVFSVISYAISPLNMQEYDYERAVKRFKIYNALSGTCAAVGLIITVILSISLAGFSGTEIIDCICFLIISLASFASFIIEIRQKYTLNICPD